jgi:hypothetical protein
MILGQPGAPRTSTRPGRHRAGTSPPPPRRMPQQVLRDGPDACSGGRVDRRRPPRWWSRRCPDLSNTESDRIGEPWAVRSGMRIRGSTTTQTAKNLHRCRRMVACPFPTARCVRPTSRTRNEPTQSCMDQDPTGRRHEHTLRHSRRTPAGIPRWPRRPAPTRQHASHGLRSFPRPCSPHLSSATRVLPSCALVEVALGALGGVPWRRVHHAVQTICQDAARRTESIQAERRGRAAPASPVIRLSPHQGFGAADGP